MPRKRQRSKYWYISYTSPNGQRVEEPTLWSSEKDKRLAAELEKSKREESKKIRSGDNSGLTFDSAAAWWLEHSEIGDKERAIHALKQLIRHFEGRALASITHAFVMAYVGLRKADGAAASTINRELTVLSSLYTAACRRFDIPDKNPVAGTKRKPPPSKLRFLTRPEAQLLLETAKRRRRAPHLYHFIFIALYTGMRKSEILELTWDRVHFDQTPVRIILAPEHHKNRTHASLALPQEVADLLREMNPEGKIVGRVFEQDDIKKSFANACRQCGFNDVTPHTLRHTCASWLVQQGVALALVKDYLRHKDIRTTMIYAHLAPDAGAAAAQAMSKFAELLRN